MSDASDQPGPAGAPAETTTPATPGQWLKQERERQGSTLQRIAAEMHLSVAIVEAIEHNNFTALSAPVFAKGHLRKYASLLGLPAERVLELYDRLEDAPREVDPVPKSQRAPEPALRPSIRDVVASTSDVSSRRGALWPAVGAVIALVVLAVLAWWALTRAGHTAAAAPSNQKGDVESVRPVESPVERQVAPVAQTQIQAATPAATRPAAPPMGVAPPGKVRIRLTFARESWVEVYDANGNRMLYDVGRIEVPRTVDAEPPAVVVLGDAEAVATEANGKLLSVPRKNISGSVARFAIAADGTIR